MPIYPYDPTTGKRLTRKGYFINPIQPMTQAEVDAQHEAVNEYLNPSDKYRHAIETLRECITEIKQYHYRYHENCKGGCPSMITIQRAKNAIARLEKMS